MIKQAPQKFLREFASKAWLRTPACVLGIFLVSLFFAAPLTAQVTVTTLSLPGGTIGVGYSQTLVATGGVAPYRWTVTAGALPAGLGINTNNGDITGPPTVVGTASFTVTATDKFGLTGSQALSITISPVPIITTPSLPGGTVGAAYSQTMAASGGTAPLTWSLSGGGSLPAGISPITGGGIIAGTPSAAGTSNFTVRVTDGAGATATKAFSITIAAALSITTSALPGGTVGVAYSQTMAATGGTAPLTWSLSAGALPGGFNPITGGGAIAGTPSAAGTANFTVRVADSVGAVATKALSITIAAPPSITTSALPGGTVGAAYSQTMAVTGGTAPLTWSLSAGTLPAGFSPITTAGVIAGTPSAAGTSNFTVRVTDGVGATATKALSITISPALSITTGALPGGTAGLAYSQTVAATGGTAPLTFSLSAGTLPAGLNPITSAGVIAGTPSAAGTSNFTVRVTDGAGATATKALSITIAAAPSITTGALPGGTAGTAYSQTVTATGGTAPLTWSLSAGALPAGLNPITSAGVIAGTPSAAGTSNFTVRVTDSLGATATKAFSVTIAAALSITTGALPGGTAGLAYSQTVAATGGTAPLTWSLSAGALPAGLNPITGAGVIAGTPSTAGTFNFTVKVTDGAGATATQALSIAIAAALSITTGALPGGTAGVAYSQTVAATGGTAPLTWSLSAGALPAGLNPITSAGVIAGTPSTTGTSNFTVRVTDSLGATATKGLSITIASPLSITTSALASGTAGAPYSQTAATTGGTAPLTWSLSAGTLPAGLNPITSAGVIAGTPSTAGTFNFTVKVTDSAGATDAKAFSITIAAALSITTSALPGSTIGVAYSQTAAATGGTAPLTFSLSAGALPTGFSPITSGGIIAGTPSAAGTFNFTVKVTDSVGATATKALSITIAAAPSITTSALPGGTAGTAYSQTVAATGGTVPLTWTLSAGALPAGLDPITSGGVIAGMPSAAGTSNFTVKVTDSVGASATKDLSITIAAPLAITISALPGGTAGTPYSQAMAATGGTAPLTWSLSAGALPAGLNPITSGGVIAGTPSAAGTSNFTVKVTDGAGATATKALSITIAGALAITTSALPDGTAGTAYSQAVAATGGTAPLTWSLSAGALPAGFSPITSGGVIAGTPSDAGTSNFTVKVTDSVGATVTKALSIRVALALSITTSALTNGHVGSVYSATLAATGGTSPYTWADVGGLLPDGLSLNTTTGVISGKPTMVGLFSFVVQVSDGGNPARTKFQALSITVGPALLITTTLLQGGNVASSYSQIVTSTGDTPPLVWSITAGSLPPGLKLNSATGEISGVPTTAGISSFTVRVTDSSVPDPLTASRDLSINIDGAAGSGVLKITTSTFPSGTVGIQYAQSMSIAGGVLPYSLSVVGAGMPPGLTLSPAGVLSGTPTEAGTFGFSVKVTDSATPAQTDTKPVSITIIPSLSITTPSLPGGDVGAPYTTTLIAAGGAQPYAWSVTGVLPGGLSLNSATGTISGTPNAVGTFDFRLNVADAVSRTTFKNFEIAVGFPKIQISIPATSQPAQQTPLDLTLSSPFPTSLSGQLTLTFSPNATVQNDDPMLQFSNGTRTANFTIAANSTTAVFSPAVQLLTGTVAGTVRIGATFVNGPMDLTAGTSEIPAAAPQFNAVEATITSSTIVVRVTGYSVIRSVTSVTFGFDVRTASGIQRVNYSRNVDSDFGTWYQNPQSAAYGSLFVFSQTLNVQGDASTIEAVVVTLTNAKGSQTSVSTPLVRK